MKRTKLFLYTTITILAFTGCKSIANIAVPKGTVVAISATAKKNVFN